MKPNGKSEAFRKSRVDDLVASLGGRDICWRRTNSAKELGMIGGPRAIQALIKAFCEDEFSDVRRIALEALVEIGEPALESLVKALGDKRPGIRQHVIQALVEIGKPAVKPLIQGISDKNVDVQWSAASVLGKIGDLRAVEPLIQSLGDKDSNVRIHAIQALSTLGIPTIEALSNGLTHQDWRVRKNAAQILATIADIKAAELLIKALGDECDDVRCCAVCGLVEIASAKAVEPLVKTLEDRNRFIRRYAAETLDKTGWEPADVSQEAKYYIAKDEWRELVKIGRLASKALIKVLGDEHPSVRKNAAQVLGQIYAACLGNIKQKSDKGESVVPVLKKLLDDKDLLVRLAARTAIHNIDPAFSDHVVYVHRTYPRDDKSISNGN